MSDTIAPHPHLPFHRLAKYSAVAVGISLLCFLPPILHFVSGPLGPFISSFIVGSRAKVKPRDGALIGLGMGLIFGGVAVIAVAAAELISAEAVAERSPLPVTWLVWLIPLVPLLYVSFLGVCGAMLGGYLARQQESTAPSASSQLS